MPDSPVGCCSMPRNIGVLKMTEKISYE